jgi:acyl-CoA thioester hydrolase
MYESTIKPRISETNAAGHIGNTVVPIWFEEGRNEFLQFALSNCSFPYMLARIEQNFKREIFYGTDVFIRTSVGKIGNSSVSLIQEVWQKGAICADGESVIVHINREIKRPATINDTMRDLLSNHIN